jgi:hypothetical protein
VLLESVNSGERVIFMDFIERTFGLSPDGGDGSIELLWIAVALAIAAMGLAHWKLRRKARG